MNLAASKGAALIGWQTLLADLSLILFMVTAAAMATSPSRVAAAHAIANLPAKNPAEPAAGEPLALWRAGGAQTLRYWLAREQPDPRQQLTITAHYRKGAAAQALAVAQALVSEAGAMGKDARVIVAPASGANGAETQASLAYDQPRELSGERLAQGLLGGGGNRFAGNQP